MSSDGTVGVLYYDFRDNTPAEGLPTTVLLAHSHDAGVTWDDEELLGGPFDMENAPFARGLFLGDYQGLVAIPTERRRRRLPRLLRSDHRRGELGRCGGGAGHARHLSGSRRAPLTSRAAAVTLR